MACQHYPSSTVRQHKASSRLEREEIIPPPETPSLPPPKTLHSAFYGFYECDVEVVEPVEGNFSCRAEPHPARPQSSGGTDPDAENAPTPSCLVSRKKALKRV